MKKLGIVFGEEK